MLKYQYTILNKKGRNQTKTKIVKIYSVYCLYDSLILNHLRPMTMENISCCQYLFSCIVEAIAEQYGIILQKRITNFASKHDCRIYRFSMLYHKTKLRLRVPIMKKIRSRAQPTLCHFYKLLFPLHTTNTAFTSKPHLHYNLLLQQSCYIQCIRLLHMDQLNIGWLISCDFAILKALILFPTDFTKLSNS